MGISYYRYGSGKGHKELKELLSEHYNSGVYATYVRRGIRELHAKTGVTELDAKTAKGALVQSSFVSLAFFAVLLSGGFLFSLLTYIDLLRWAAISLAISAAALVIALLTTTRRMKSRLAWLYMDKDLVAFVEDKMGRDERALKDKLVKNLELRPVDVSEKRRERIGSS
ncbi:MAG: hypothetical protein QXU82_02035 [Candidatus Aenigmatarchaeota archaeon]